MWISLSRYDWKKKFKIQKAYFDNKQDRGKYTYFFLLDNKNYVFSVNTKPHDNQGYISMSLVEDIKFLIALKKKDLLIKN